MYQLNYRGSINKLYEVDGIEINKYKLSKFLGKYSMISCLIDDNIESRFEKDIDKIFNKKTIIDNYTTWERIIKIFIINSRFDALEKFVEKIYKAVNEIEHEKNNNVLQLIQKSLAQTLVSNLCRSFTLCWGEKAKSSIEKILEIISKDNKNDKSNFYKMRENYCLTRMSDKYISCVMIDYFIKRNNKNKLTLNDMKNINLSNFSEIINCGINNVTIIEEQNYIYYPYMVTIQDICVQLNIEGMISRESDEKSESNINMNCIELYVKLNYGDENEGCCSWLENSISNKDITDRFVFQNKKAQYIGVNNDNSSINNLKIAVSNTTLNQSDFKKALTGKPNRSYQRYKNIIGIINIAIKEKADMLVMPENLIPYEWVPVIARFAAKNQLAIIAGIEHLRINNYVYNYTATILPYYKKGDFRYAYITFHLKMYYSPKEEELIEGYHGKIVKGEKFELYCWNDIWFSVYCCYELASIKERAIFKNYVDMLIMVEWNPDTNYYSNIVESLSRDLHCYCVQVNSADYGDSRITSPSKTEKKDIVKIKGGDNSTALIGNIEIGKLRDFQIKGYELQKEDDSFKITPPGIDCDIIKDRIDGKLGDRLNDKSDSKEN